MKATSMSKPKQSVLKVAARRRIGLPKTAAGIEKWILAMGGKPVDAVSRERLMKAGHWGMPAE